MRLAWSQNFKQTIITIKRSFLPATLLAAALVLFFAQNPFEFDFSNILHYCFLAINLAGLLFLALTNQNKPFFSLGMGLACYLLLNWLKSKAGDNFITDSRFLWLCFLMPLNFGLFYFLPTGKLRTMQSVYILAAILVELAFIDRAGNLIAEFPYIEICWQSMPLWLALLWFIVLACQLLAVCFRATHLNLGLFYGYCSLFLGFIYADTPSGLSVFFLGFALILTTASLLDFHHRYYYDDLENVESYATFLAHCANRFAFKYSIGIFSIDNRDKWRAEIGAGKLQTLEQMIVQKIREFPEEYDVYRYNHEEYIIIFNNQNNKQARDNAENIRRTIAAAEFVFTSGKSIKITVSVAIAEKTRKYMEGAIVAERAHEGLQKSHKFNSNIVTIVPN